MKKYLCFCFDSDVSGPLWIPSSECVVTIAKSALYTPMMKLAMNQTKNMDVKANNNISLKIFNYELNVIYLFSIICILLYFYMYLVF